MFLYLAMKGDDSMHQPANKNNLDERNLEVTRAYEQGLKDAQIKGHEPAGSSDDKKSGLLSDLSVPQVAAGALAAVTSMLLTNQIGIAGSVIGVAVGSVVSTVASSVYKRMVATGASTIKEKISTSDDEQGVTRPLDVHEGTVDASGARIAPEELRQRVHAQQAARTHKKVAVGVIVVAVVAALIGVALSAGFVSLATAGQGLGTKTSLVAPKEPQKNDQAAAADNDTQKSAAAKPESSAENSSNTPQDSSAATNGNSDAGDQNAAAAGGDGTNSAANNTSNGGSSTNPQKPEDGTATPPSDSSTNGDQASGNASGTPGAQQGGQSAQGTQGTQGQASAQSTNN